MKTKTLTFAPTLLFCFLFFLLSLPAGAQVPQSFKYQAVLRDEAGQLMKDRALTMRVSIYEASIVRYQETHPVSTNEYGLVHIEVGRGTPVSGSIAAIDWSAGDFFLQTEINAGAGYVNLGRSQLLSVPYSLHAKTADEIKGGITETDPVFGSSAASGITSGHITNWNAAHLWGNHATAGYLTSFSETDPTWSGAANTSSAIGRTGDVGIGTTAPSAQFHTTGTLRFSGAGTPGPGKILTSDANGNATWQTPGGVGGSNWTVSGANIYNSNTRNVGIGTPSPGALLHVHGTGQGQGNVIFTGDITLPAGNPPVEGPGARMMWYPDIAAFRAGQVDGTHWDKTNLGFMSFAAGLNTIASGMHAVSIGTGTRAEALGSIALGSFADASYDYSTALGYGTKAHSAYETVIGKHNTAYNAVNSWGWNPADRLFVIGNGTGSSPAERSNAMTVLKNGNVGIGVTTPAAQFHTNGSIRFAGAGTPGAGRVLTSDENGNATWQNESDPTWSGSNNTTGDIGRTGRVGIGTDMPLAQFHTTGTVRFSGAGTPGAGKILTSDAFGGGTWQNETDPTWSGATNTTGSIGRTGAVGIGTATPAAQLHTTGSVRFGGAGGPGEGKVLTSDASGNATWQSQPPGISPLSCIDLNGNAYPTIVIGNQVWMAENLRVTKYSNGNDIPNITGNAAWGALTSGAFCFYDNNWLDNSKYGALYNWYAVNDPRGLCPKGWRVPTDAEWAAFINMLGGSGVAGGKLKAVSPLWDDPNTDATNSTGFSALPGGYRGADGSFLLIGYAGRWWSSTEYSSADAWRRGMSYYYGSVYRYYNNKSYGFSVRCLRDL